MIDFDGIFFILVEVGLPIGMIDVIMKYIYICSASMQVLWNGEATEEFKPSRGVRQGDPLSPYIFVLCLERLAHLINVKVGNGKWKPIRIGRNGPALSHLLFADDLVLFAEASVNQIRVILDCLNNVCASSGHKISSAKTRIFCSKNVSQAATQDISKESGFFSLTHNLGN